MVLQEVEQERTDISSSTCITLQEFLQDEIMLQHAENERRLARARNDLRTLVEARDRTLLQLGRITQLELLGQYPVKRRRCFSTFSELLPLHQ